MHEVHKQLSFEHNGERSREESAWTWECSCGACESASTKDECHFEWRMHIKDRVDRPAKEMAEWLHGLIEMEVGRVLSLDQAAHFIGRVLTGKRAVIGDELREKIFKGFGDGKA